MLPLGSGCVTTLAKIYSGTLQQDPGQVFWPYGIQKPPAQCPSAALRGPGYLPQAFHLGERHSWFPGQRTVCRPLSEGEAGRYQAQGAHAALDALAQAALVSTLIIAHQASPI